MANAAKSDASLPIATDRSSLSNQTLVRVIDAIPDSLMVIDLDHNVVLANRAASAFVDDESRGRAEAVKCYQMSHKSDQPCDCEDFPCPLRDVVGRREPVRCQHVHRDSGGREFIVEITASPIFDETGRIIQVVESCRDITERTVAQRLLEIGNRHWEMDPLLTRIAKEVRYFMACRAVGVHVFDAQGRTAFFQFAGDGGSANDGGDRAACWCGRLSHGELPAGLNPLSLTSTSVWSGSEQKAVEIADLEAHACDDACCPVCGCHCFAVLPVRLAGTVLGAISLFDCQWDHATVSRLQAVERLATEVGHAMERVRAAEALKLARDQLEVRVRERTQELQSLNETLQREMAQRRQLEWEAIRAASREQQRIGQELHDDIGQTLTGLSYLARSLSQQLDHRGKEGAMASELADAIPQVLAKIRRVVQGMVPLELGEYDLPTALDYLAATTRERTGIECDFQESGQPRVDDGDTAAQLYRIAQEAVNNAVRHGQASRINVRLQGSADSVVLVVEDDGVGIDDEVAVGCGLHTMQYRAQVIDAEIQIARKPEGGTAVRCRLPQRAILMADEVPFVDKEDRR